MLMSNLAATPANRAPLLPHAAVAADAASDPTASATLVNAALVFFANISQENDNRVPLVQYVHVHTFPHVSTCTLARIVWTLTCTQTRVY